MSLTVQYDTTAVQAILARLPEDLRDKGAQLAVNRTAAKAKTEMRRQIIAVYNLKSAEVGGALNTTPASLKKGIVSAALFPASLFGSKKGRAMNVIHFVSVLNNGFKTRGSKAKKGDISALGNQLGFQFKKTGGIKKIPAPKGKSFPFIGNKGRTVFRRTGQPSAKNPKIEGIEPVQVIGLPQMFNTRALNEAVLKKAAADLVIESESAVRKLLADLK